MNVKKHVCLLAALAMLTLTLAACAEDNKQDTETAASGSEVLTDTQPAETAAQPGTAAEAVTKAPSECELNGHTWTVTKDEPASCTHNGTRTVLCSVCGEKESEKPSMLGHEYADGFCTRCGMIEGAETRFQFKTTNPQEGYGVSGYIGAAANGEYGAQCRTETAALKSIILPNVYDTWNSTKKAYDHNKVTRAGQLFDVPCECETLIVPEGYTSMSSTCLAWEKLTSVSLPSTLTAIDIRTFSGCRQLTEIVIPDSVTVIGEQAFYNCGKLKKIVIPDSVTTIEAGAFEGCYSLEEVVLPAGLTKLPDRLFYGCSSLKSVNIPDSVTRVGSMCDFGCSSLPAEIHDKLQPKK